ncbi:hypothetical protein BT63DRAFT_417227 [Microthyrium microscopicum]|uniref:Uncharacterized protein n=1 Tax=Microthyrium microscopicum TaxID=703497 RepID=A0A6A6U2P4_9PEZI|nr:hypothetical protein BT63DRAFT_417227 [Microthyrium microscopicum]
MSTTILGKPDSAGRKRSATRLVSRIPVEDIVSSLHTYGAIDAKETHECNLKGTIPDLLQSWIYDIGADHPIHSPIRDKVYNLPRYLEVYGNMKNILKLAAKLMYHESLHHFWVALICGSNGPELNQAQRLEESKVFLEQLAERIKIGFFHIPFDMSKSATKVFCFSSATGKIVKRKIDIPLNLRWSTPTSPSPDSTSPPAASRRRARSFSITLPSQQRVQRPSIFFPPPFRQTLDGLSALPPEHQQRFELYFAVSLVSALAEATVKVLTGQGKVHQGENPGQAWQRSVFGGVIIEQNYDPIAWQSDKIASILPYAYGEVAAAGLILDRSMCADETPLRDISTLALLRMDWISSLLREETWQDLSTEQGASSKCSGSFMDGALDEDVRYDRLVGTDPKLGTGFVIWPTLDH